MEPVLYEFPTHIQSFKLVCWYFKTFLLQGAGDMFVGGLAFYLAYYPELPMKEIVKRSCEVATVSVLKYGTQTSFPTKDDLPAELFM